MLMAYQTPLFLYRNNHSDSNITAELFHLKASVETLLRVFNNEKPYPNLDREDVL